MWPGSTVRMRVWCRVSFLYISPVHNIPFAILPVLVTSLVISLDHLSTTVGNIVVFSSLLSVDSHKTVIIQGEFPFYLDIPYYNSFNSSDSTTKACMIKVTSRLVFTEVLHD